MVVVDTSVWIDFFRGREPGLVKQLSHLLDEGEVALPAPVRLEILAGSARSEVARLRRLLSALPLLVPEPAVWKKLEAWIEKARSVGERFGALDLLVAGTADDHGATLWSRDEDFKRMAKLGFVKLHTW